MRSLRYVPGPPLSLFIETFWLFEGDAPRHPKERLLPDGSVSVVFSLREDPYSVYGQRGSREQIFRGGSMSGPQSEYFVLDTSAEESVIGVQFKPGGAFPFFQPPLDEFTNLHLSARDVWGEGAEQLAEALPRVSAAAAQFRLLEQFLLTRLGHVPRRHPAVQFALQQFTRRPGAGIADVVEKTGLSSRRFIEVFRAETGLAPKLFCRLQRFQMSLRRLQGSGPFDLTDAALDCGYFDQAHFIHEFREFAGVTPGAYLHSAPRHPNHVPLLD